MHRLIVMTVVGILFLTGVLMYSSAWNDAAVVDEDPHIGAGISYLAQRDMRLNPEHPPLVKDLAALPLLLIPGLRVPSDHSSWTNDVNGQWDFGRAFLFESGNDADKILRLARLAPIAITLLLGWFLFQWTHQRAGTLAGFLALLLYVSNPVVLAHGRLVTTDVPAAAGTFIATIFFLRSLTQPSLPNLLTAGIAFGLAQLTKFSVALLVPYFAVLAVGYGIISAFNGEQRRDNAQTSMRNFAKTFRVLSRQIVRSSARTMLIGLIGLLIIYVVYLFHVWNYPAARQTSDTAFILSSFPQPAIAEAIVAMSNIPWARPLAQYLLGLAMVAQRATGGNTTYFLGEVSASGWRSYFPIIYLVKMPLAFHLLSAIAMFAAAEMLSGKPLRPRFRHGNGERQEKRIRRTFALLSSLASRARTYFAELAMLLFIAIYWYTSLTSNLNIGVRHLMPTVPFIIVLTAIGVRRFLRIPTVALTPSVSRAIMRIVRTTVGVSIRSATVAFLVLWMVIAGLAAWPSYLASFNELAALRGGGVNWAVDSNLDWGQDLKRLASFVEKRGIDRIAIDYFGWTPPAYYIKTADIVYWDKGKGRPTGWFAVSATFKQQWCAKAVAGFKGDTTSYCFLNAYRPEAIIGGSIYVYRLP